MTGKQSMLEAAEFFLLPTSYTVTETLISKGIYPDDPRYPFAAAKFRQEILSHLERAWEGFKP